MNDRRGAWMLTALTHALGKASSITRTRLGLAVVGVAVVGALLVGGQFAGAQANVYVVQPNETLTVIALRVYGNASLWPTIYEANRALIGPDPNLILPGQRLAIPQVVQHNVVQVAAVAQSYVVQPGDTLQLIAFRVHGNGASWLPIYQANRALIGPDPNILRVGATLTIPAVSYQAAQQVATIQQVVVQAVPLQTLYTLRPGDTLVGVSERFYGSYVYWPTIYELNRAALGPDPVAPPVGAVVVLPTFSVAQGLVQPQVIAPQVIAPQVVAPQVVAPQVVAPRPAVPQVVAAAQPAPQPQAPTLLLDPGPQIALPLRTFGAGGQAAATYTVQQGDTLLTIAQQFYGDSNQWARIYSANSTLIGANPANVPVGSELVIPN
jgi:nucleoid-associated protein YgaU